MSTVIKLIENYSDGTSEVSNANLDGDLTSEKIAMTGYKLFSRRRNDGKTVDSVDARVVVEQSFKMNLGDDGELFINGSSVNDLDFTDSRVAVKKATKRDRVLEGDDDIVNEVRTQEKETSPPPLPKRTESVRGGGREELPEAVQNELRKKYPMETFFRPSDVEGEGGVEYISYFDNDRFYEYRPQWGEGDPNTKSEYQHGTKLKGICYFQVKIGEENVRIFQVIDKPGSVPKMVREETLISAPKEKTNKSKIKSGDVRDTVDLVNIADTPDPSYREAMAATAEASGDDESIGDTVSLKRF